VDQSSDIIVVTDQDNVYKYFSPSAERLLGYSLDELNGVSRETLLHPDDRSALRAHLEHVIANPGVVSSPITYRMRRRDGAWRILETVFTNLLDEPAVRGVVGNARDITERARAERLLARSEARLRAIIDTASDAVIITDEAGRIISCNPATAGIFGYAPEVINGKPMSMLVAGLLEEGTDAPGSDRAQEMTGVRDDGSEFPVEVSLARSRAGEDAFCAVFVRDITARKRNQERALAFTAALERSNRELEEFAYVASHDLRAPLVSLRGMATMLREDQAEQLDDDGRLYLERLIVNADHMQKLLDELLDISRVGRSHVDLEQIDLDRILDRILAQQRHTLEQRGGTVQRDPLPTLQANATRMGQLFANLIDNALKYTPLERAPAIEICVSEQPDSWEFRVRDNGVGIPEQYQAKVFSMFQRLPEGMRLNPTGTGMGLALIARIVETHGGKIWIEPNGDDPGTTFRFTLSKSAASVATVTSMEEDRGNPRGSELVAHLSD